MQTEQAQSDRITNLGDSPGTLVVRLHLIGRMDVRTVHGEDILPRPRKTRALLAIVALSAPRPVLRTRLAHLLWSRRPEEQSRASLRQEIHQLRASFSRAIPIPEVLQITRDHLSFRPGTVWVDVEEIMRAKTENPAVLPFLNGAELLDDLNGVDPAFNAWLAIERQRLRDHSRKLAEAWLLKQIGPEARVSAAQRLLEFDRSHEGAWRALMRAHVDRGERGMAIRAYERCRAALTELLDAEPSLETDTLLWQIRGLPESPSAPQARAGGEEIADDQPLYGGDPRVGVLPFQMEGATEEDARLASCLVEEITCALTRLRWISVISSNALARVAAGQRDQAAVRRAFDVDFLLDGAMRRARGNHLRITASLLDLRGSNRVAWADRFDLESTDALSVWDDLAAELASRIAMEIQHCNDAPRQPEATPAEIDGSKAANRKSVLSVDSD